jgi:hypothetical protein
MTSVSTLVFTVRGRARHASTLPRLERNDGRLSTCAFRTTAWNPKRFNRIIAYRRIAAFPERTLDIAAATP